MAKKKISSINTLDDLVKSFMSDDRIKVVDTKKQTVSTQIIKTGFPTIDYVTAGGIPKGKLIRICGEEGAGKSTLAKQISVLLGRNIFYVDTEYAYDQKNTDAILPKDSYDNLILASSDSTENVCDMVRKSIPFFDVLIWDSLQNTASEEELGKTANERSRANRAIVMSSELPKIMYLLDKHQKTMILISQVSENQNKTNKYDRDYVVSGGKRLAHNVYLDLWLYKSSQEKSADSKFGGSKIVKGIDSRIVCEKLRNNPTYRSGRLTIPYDPKNYSGFTREEDIFRCGEELGIITGRYKYNDVKIGNSKEDAKQFLRDNPDVTDELYELIYTEMMKKEQEEIENQ